MKKYQMYVGGEWINPSSGEWFESFNPFTGEPWALIARGNAQDADQAIRTAHTAFTEGPWPQMTASQRGHIMGFWADEAGPMPGRVSLCTVCGMAGKYYFAEMKAVGGAVYLGCRTQKQM